MRIDGGGITEMRRQGLCAVLLLAAVTVPLSGCATQRGGTIVNSRMPRKEIQFYRAEMAESGGQLERARVMYESVYRLDPSNDLVCRRLAAVHSRQGNYDAAKRYLREAHRLNGNNAEVLAELGHVCYVSGDIIGAQEALQAALKIDPLSPRVQANIALLNAAQDQQQTSPQQLATNDRVQTRGSNPPPQATATPSAPVATPVAATIASAPAESQHVISHGRTAPAVIHPSVQQAAQLQSQIAQIAFTTEPLTIRPEVVTVPVITPSRSSQSVASIPDTISPRTIVAGDYVRLCADAGEDVKSLLTSMNSQRADPMKSAILQLGVMGNNAQSALPAIRFTLNHSNPLVRIHSALALWRIEQNTEDTLPVFVNGLRDTNPDVRAFAAAALEMGPRDMELITPLTSALSDSSPFVRLHAAAALYQFSQQQTTASYVIVSHLTDSEANVRWLAAFLLGEILPRSEITVQALVRSLHDSDNRIRIAAAFALRGLGSDANAALPELRKLATDRQPEIRKAAEEAIRDIEPPAAVAGT